jgi:hypothetical protein
MIMKSFKQHLLEATRVYKYRIKFCFVPSDEQIETLDHFLQKYDPIEISAPRKTIVQKTPLDFQDVENAEVAIIDLVTSQPVSPYVLQQEVRTWLTIPERFVVVRGENDPLELQTDQINAKQAACDQADEEDLEPKAKLSTDSEYPEYEHTPPGENYFGDKQADSFKQYLQSIQGTRKVHVKMPYNIPPKVSEIPQDDNNFNQHVEGAPKVYPGVLAKKGSKNDDAVKMPIVNFNDDFGEYRFAYEDPTTGKVKIITKSVKVIK